MKPFYRNDTTTIINADCLEYLKTLEDNSIDLILTDPPYGIGESGTKNHSRGKLAETTKYEDFQWDNKIPNKETFYHILRVSKNAIIFGGNYFIENLTNSSCWIVWDKDNGKTDFADCELAWTNFTTAVRKFKFKWQGMLQEDMKNKEKRYHPTQKPVELFVDILKEYYKEGIVMDCFGGSGTTAIACEKLGIPNIIIEREPKYCEIIKNRLSTMQMRLGI